MLCCVAVWACQIDSRSFRGFDRALEDDGSGDGLLLVQPSSVAYGPITLEFSASARLLVENVGATALGAPAVSLQDSGAGAFVLTRNDCTRVLERGSYCEVAVAFRPSETSAREAMLTITGSGGRFEIPLSGSGLVPGGLLLQAVPGAEAPFGEVPLQGEQEATLELRNPLATSLGPIELISNNGAFRLLPAQAGECASSGGRLAGGQSCNFRVRFAPAQRGVTEATITARSPDSGSVSLGVSGRALAPARMLAQPARLDFGDVVVGGAGLLDIAIVNAGDEPLPPVSSRVLGEAVGVFRVGENGCSTPLSPGQTCSVSVAFAPAATGPFGAVLELEGGSAGSLGVDLSGTGLSAGSLLVAAADGRDGDFRSVVVGGQNQRQFYIGNTSNEASGVITIAVNSDDFGIEPPTGDTPCVSGRTNLAGGASCDIRVRFAPTQRTQRNATLTVSSPVGGTAFNLSGVGLAPAEFRADGALDFGAISQGSTTTRDVMVANPGDEPLPALSTRVSGANGASFSVQSNGCRQGLDARASCAISMAFAPTMTGSQVATLTLEGASGARDVTLSGTGTAPALLEVQPIEIAFDDVDVGLSSRAALTVTNRGAAETGRVSAGVATVGPGFSVAPGTCTTPLASGASCQLEVMFAPTVAGPHSGAVRVTSTPGGTLEVPVSGAGNAPSTLTLSAADGTDFGGVNVGTSAELPFRISNTGRGAAGVLLGISLGDSFSVAPRVGTECQPNVTQLDSGARCDFRVLFQPSVGGSFATTLRVSTSLGGDAQLPLTGSGAIGMPALVGSASTLQFPRTAILNQSSAGTVTWTVSNLGTGPTETVVFTNSNTEEFPVTTNTCFGSIPVGGECSALLTFDPNAAGQRTTLLTLTAGRLGTSATVIGIAMEP
jgi:hypothetical protein